MPSQRIKHPTGFSTMARGLIVVGRCSAVAMRHAVTSPAARDGGTIILAVVCHRSRRPSDFIVLLKHFDGGRWNAAAERLAARCRDGNEWCGLPTLAVLLILPGWLTARLLLPLARRYRLTFTQAVDECGAKHGARLHGSSAGSPSGGCAMDYGRQRPSEASAQCELVSGGFLRPSRRGQCRP